LTHIHLYLVYGEPDCVRDYLRLPFAYDKSLPKPWSLSLYAFCTAQCLYGFAYDVPQMPLERQVEYILMMFAFRYRMTDALPIQRLPASESLCRYHGGTTEGITAAQYVKLRSYPFLQMKWKRYPENVPPLPAESLSFERDLAEFQKYYRVLGISQMVHKQLQQSHLMHKPSAVEPLVSAMLSAAASSATPSAAASSLTDRVAAIPDHTSVTISDILPLVSSVVSPPPTSNHDFFFDGRVVGCVPLDSDPDSDTDDDFPLPSG
jgi:hypothetical protein